MESRTAYYIIALLTNLHLTLEKKLIILLYGEPGVGKSFTADMADAFFTLNIVDTPAKECVAAYTQRLLFSVTCGTTTTRKNLDFTDKHRGYQRNSKNR